MTGCIKLSDDGEAVVRIENEGRITMRKLVAICLILVLMIGAATPGYCYGPFRKLCRGMFNVAFCPYEIVNRSKEVWVSSGPIEGLTTGVIKGIVMMAFRGGIGFFEILLFPIPIPEHYEPALNDPEFFFFEWPSKK